ncbi:phage major capsid protein [Tritonibacter horizontis]|uniref:Phage capsid family protein n=1 Tax=Tritonibacter horizontis TaxID=1768241 RepID=A0A132BU29_9RHOB|nr:phage major capsid protein [Tritonibacter horizontis]KUP91794.1 phage capsid family protein [Tritonibacter horizontis]
MTKIKELRDKAKKVLEDATALRDGVTEKTPKEEARAANDTFDAMMDHYDDLVKEADREERACKARQDAEQRRDAQEREEREARRPGQDSISPAGGGVNVSDEYREAFRQYLATGADQSEMDKEARDALRAGYREHRGQATGTGAAGGFLVPTTLASAINIAAAAHGPMMDANVATEINMANGAPFDLPKVDDTEEEANPHTEGEEGADDNSGDIVLAKTSLLAYTLVTPWIRWSFELAQDASFGFEALLAKLIGERIGRTGNKWLTVGTGVEQPLGFVTGAPVGHVAAASVALTFDEIMDLEHSVDPAYRGGPKVRFQMHDQTVKALRKLKDTNGRYIWSDGDVTRGVPATLNSKPVSFNQAMAQIGASAKPIAFGDFSEYYVRKVGNPLIGVAREKFFPNLGIMGVHRVDGAPAQTKAIKTLQMAA